MLPFPPPNQSVPADSKSTSDVRRISRCLGCDYPLRGLTEPRCPECGRAFDPRDITSVNVGRPLGAFGRLLVSPPGRWSYFVAYLPFLLLLWAAAYPGSYHMMLNWRVGFVAFLLSGI